MNEKQFATAERSIFERWYATASIAAKFLYWRRRLDDIRTARHTPAQDEHDGQPRVKPAAASAGRRCSSSPPKR